MNKAITLTGNTVCIPEDEYERLTALAEQASNAVIRVVDIDPASIELTSEEHYAGIALNDDKPIPGHWRQLQNIKNELFGHEATAVEFYPPESSLEDVANIYWLWVIPPEAVFSV